MSSSAPTPQNASGARDFVKQSSLYQEFLAEREEILRHKWLESERLGYDIGFERALLDWIRKHRDSWRAARRSQGGSALAAVGRPLSPFGSPSVTAHTQPHGHPPSHNHVHFAGHSTARVPNGSGSAPAAPTPPAPPTDGPR